MVRVRLNGMEWGVMVVMGWGVAVREWYSFFRVGEGFGMVCTSRVFRIKYFCLGVSAW